MKDVQDVKLQVFDISGRLVKTLVNNKTSPGRHQVVFDASNLSSGIYLLRMQAGYFIDTKKIRNPFQKQMHKNSILRIVKP